jgi:hypothetical protein
VAAAVAAVALAIMIGGEPPPTFALDWDVVEDRIQARWPAVRSVSYDPDEDFVTVVVTDSTTVEEAAAASCATVFPVMHNAGSRALFAIYTEDGRIVASWNRCVALPPG